MIRKQASLLLLRLPWCVLRFYGYNLATAAVLTVVFFFPLLYLLFFYWSYPVILWFVPYYLLMALLLGRVIQQGLQEYAPHTGAEPSA